MVENLEANFFPLAEGFWARAEGAEKFCYKEFFTRNFFFLINYFNKPKNKFSKNLSALAEEFAKRLQQKKIFAEGAEGFSSTGYE